MMLSVELENLKADDILLDKIQVQTIIYSMESTIMSTCTQMCVYTYFEDFVIKDLTTLRKWNCQELVVFQVFTIYSGDFRVLELQKS